MTDRRLRICQFTPCLWSGGTEERIARVLHAMDRREFDISWLGFGPIREALIERAGPGVRVVAVPRNPAGGVEPRIIARTAMILRRIRPDVIHVHNWSTSLYGIGAARLAGVPQVLYGTGGREVPDPPGKRRQTLMRTFAPHVDQYTTVCEFLARELVTYWGASEDRIAVLRTGVDLERIAQLTDRRSARAQLGIPEDAIVIGAISVFRPVKRIPDLIDAVGRLGKTRPNIHLLLLGNAVRMTVEELRGRADARGLSGRFHMPGRIEDPASVLPAFDVFVNCSRFEGSSNAIIEAMAAKIAVVGTAVGGTPELIEHDVNGMLVPPEDVGALASALERLVDDPELRARCGANGRKRAERRHSQAEMVQGYLQLYREAAARARTGSPMQRWSRLMGIGRSLWRAAEVA